MMQGLTISVVGLLITFLALGLFILVMVVLQKAFPVKQAAQKVEDDQEPIVRVEIDQSYDTGEDEQAIVAAIAAAISYCQEERQIVLGATLESGRGRWWMTHRMTAHQSVILRKN